MSDKKHWEQVYQTKAEDAVSWFQPRAEKSLGLIQACGLPKDAPIIDVGGGASVLVDDLLAAGFTELTVLDLSGAALGQTRTRLGQAAGHVRWLEADITTVELPAAQYALWHDRAVFHFLTEADQRAAYVARLRHALQPGGHLILATFAEDGPERCSGLPVCRYSAEALSAELGAEFVLQTELRDEHHTPFGTSQRFLYCHFRYQPEAAGG
ncbi:MAG: class I SAM-dependent methyltransferase [Gammaproteobacteria bacterium]|nr:class I SAM-dependent methyltransferase [Gammaproteobacteria bacterium]